MGKIDELKASSNSPMMGRIERMVAEMCPEGVKWVSLGDLLDYEQPTKYIVNDTNYDESYPTPVLTAGQSFILGYTNESEGIYKASKDNPVIIFDDFVTSFHWVDFDFKVKSSAMKMLHPKDNSNSFRYIYYAMSCIGFIPSEHTRHWISKYSQFEIPLPPLPIQEAIADILDKFDRLSAELQAELQARKQQYEYYRNQLLTRFAPDQPVTEYSLGELGTFTRGTGLQKSDFVDEGFPCIHYGQIYTRFKTFTDKTLTFVEEELAQKLLHADSGDLIIATTSENVEDVCKSVAWLGEGQIVTGGHACVYHHNQNPKYMAYFFQTDYFHNQKKKYAYGAKVIDIKVDNIAKITIPLPSLEEQARIVSILDKFEALVNDLSQGLPAEIAAVQEQYEYYRNKLLTFEKMS